MTRSTTPTKLTLPDIETALPGRSETMKVAARHAVLDAPLNDEFVGYDRALFGMGCFWGAERLFWSIDGVISTAVGYSGGFTANPTYEEVCTGRTGHNEVVRIIFDAQRLSYERLLTVFWENHDPTQGMRQGADHGTQYRSGIYISDTDHRIQAEASRSRYQGELDQRGLDQITTEIVDATEFYFAEDHHQQYLAKNPRGYCGLGGTGVSCPVGSTT